MTVVATQKTGKKTSKTGGVFIARCLKSTTLKPTPQKAVINENVFVKATDLTHYRIIFILYLAEVGKAD